MPQLYPNQRLNPLFRSCASCVWWGPHRVRNSRGDIEHFASSREVDRAAPCSAYARDHGAYQWLTMNMDHTNCPGWTDPNVVPDAFDQAVAAARASADRLVGPADGNQ